jgi:CheY-like chemotaxis protein
MSAKRVRILVADDQAVNRKLTMRQLEKLGCTVDVVANGREALDAVSRTRYDLIFMDCHMPGMDGFEVTKEIRRLEGSGPRTPVIALTASVRGRDREHCLAAGMDDFVQKPMSEPELIRVLSQWIPGRPAIDAATVARLQQTDAELLAEVIGIYLAEGPAQIASIRDAVAKHDPQLLASAAHALKSSSGNVGALRVREICSELETIGRSGGVDGAAELVDQLGSEYQRAERALRDLHHL